MELTHRERGRSRHHQGTMNQELPAQLKIPEPASIRISLGQRNGFPTSCLLLRESISLRPKCPPGPLWLTEAVLHVGPATARKMSPVLERRASHCRQLPKCGEGVPTGYHVTNSHSAVSITPGPQTPSNSHILWYHKNQLSFPGVLLHSTFIPKPPFLQQFTLPRKPHPLPLTIPSQSTTNPYPSSLHHFTLQS